MAMGTGGLDPSAPPASASPAEHWWQVQCRVPCQGHAPDETSRSFPHRIPLELPLSAGDGVGSRGSLPADPPALLLDQYSRHPKHFVVTAIYLHPKKVLLRVGSDLRLRCCVCAALEILDLLAVPDPMCWPWQCQHILSQSSSAVLSPPWGWGALLGTLILSVLWGRAACPCFHPWAAETDRGSPQVPAEERWGVQGEKKGMRLCHLFSRIMKSCPKHRQPFFHHGIVHYKTRKN